MQWQQPKIGLPCNYIHETACALLEMIKLYQVPIVFDHDPSNVFDVKNSINGR